MRVARFVRQWVGIFHLIHRYAVPLPHQGEGLRGLPFFAQISCIMEATHAGVGTYRPRLSVMYGKRAIRSRNAKSPKNKRGRPIPCTKEDRTAQTVGIEYDFLLPCGSSHLFRQSQKIPLFLYNEYTFLLSSCQERLWVMGHKRFAGQPQSRPAGYCFGYSSVFPALRSCSRLTAKWGQSQIFSVSEMGSVGAAQRQALRRICLTAGW